MMRLELMFGQLGQHGNMNFEQLAKELKITRAQFAVLEESTNEKVQEITSELSRLEKIVEEVCSKHQGAVL